MTKPWTNIRNAYGEKFGGETGELGDIRNLLADADALLAVVRAAQMKKSWERMRQAVKWSRGNYRHIGDYPTVNAGARSFLRSDRIYEIDKALAALPEHLK